MIDSPLKSSATMAGIAGMIVGGVMLIVAMGVIVEYGWIYVILTLPLTLFGGLFIVLGIMADRKRLQRPEE